MAHSDAQEGKWRGNWRMEWVVSTVTLPRNLVYPALLPLMRTPRLPVVDWTDAPADLNGLVRFAERTIMVSARVPSYFKRSLPTCHVHPSSYIGATKLNLARSEEVSLYTFSGAFTKFRKANISFVMSVHLSICMEQIGSKWTDFHENFYLNTFRKCRENSRILKTWQE